MDSGARSTVEFKADNGDEVTIRHEGLFEFEVGQIVSFQIHSPQGAISAIPEKKESDASS